MEIKKFSKKLESNFIKTLRIKNSKDKPILLLSKNPEATNIEFIQQFEYKFSFRVRIEGNDDGFYYETNIVDVIKSENTKPLDIIIMRDDTIKVVCNTTLSNMHVLLNSNKKEACQESKEIQTILHYTTGCGGELKEGKASQLIDRYIVNKFAFKMQLSELSKCEMMFLDNTFGPSNFLETKETISEGYCYDINSQHPYILQKAMFFFPVKNGVEKTLKSNDEMDSSKFGLYRIIIDQASHPKYFNASKTVKFYTVSTYYIRFLDDIGTKYSLIQDGKPNAIEYNINDCVSSRYMFGSDIDLLYRIRKKNKLAKLFTHQLVGRLSRGIQECNVETIEDRKFFDAPKYRVRMPTARLLPIVYDLCRIDLYKYIGYFEKKNIKIYRIKSDSFVLSKMIKENRKIRCEGDIGQLKYEGFFKDFAFESVCDGRYKELLVL